MLWRKWRYCDFHKVSAWFVRAEMNSPKLIFVSSETTLYPLIISLTWDNSELYRIGKMLIEKLLRNAIFLFWNVDFQKRSMSSNLHEMVPL